MCRHQSVPLAVDKGEESKNEVDTAGDDDEKSLFFVDHDGDRDDVSCQVSDFVLLIAVWMVRINEQ